MNFLTHEQRTIGSQRVRIEELEEEVRQMRQNLAPVVLFPTSWGLTVTQQRMLTAFCKSPNGFLTHEQLFIVTGSNAEEADNLVKVQINRLRRATEHLGIKVVNKFTLGYEITPESKAFVKSTLERCTA
jgi:DNA-binding response OmpR family regulator